MKSTKITPAQVHFHTIPMKSTKSKSLYLLQTTDSTNKWAILRGTKRPNKTPIPSQNLGPIAIKFRKNSGRPSCADSPRRPAAVHSTSVAPDHGFAAPLSRRAASRRWRGEARGGNRSRLCDASHLGGLRSRVYGPKSTAGPPDKRTCMPPWSSCPAWRATYPKPGWNTTIGGQMTGFN